MTDDKNNELAGIQYAGVPGSSYDCQHAVMQLLQYGQKILLARILTCSQTHCLLLTMEEGDLVGIKSGFTSGFGGTGPSCFSYTLQLLYAHGAQIEEIR